LEEARENRALGVPPYSEPVGRNGHSIPDFEHGLSIHSETPISVPHLGRGCEPNTMTP
jgi:hypothetical protein